jgi:hypothetical protein
VTNVGVAAKTPRELQIERLLAAEDDTLGVSEAELNEMREDAGHAARLRDLASRIMAGDIGSGDVTYWTNELAEVQRWLARKLR